MTPAEADAVAPNWIGYAVKVSHGVSMPPGYSPEDWRAEALLGLAASLLSWRPRRGYLSSPGAPSRHLRRSIRMHLLTARRLAMSSADSAPHYGADVGRGRFHSAMRLEGPSPGLDDGEPLTLGETIPDPSSPDPLQTAIDRETLDRLTKAAKWLTEPERVSLGLMLRGISAPEAAELLGISRQTAGARERRVRSKLRPVFA